MGKKVKLTPYKRELNNLYFLAHKTPNILIES